MSLLVYNIIEVYMKKEVWFLIIAGLIWMSFQDKPTKPNIPNTPNTPLDVPFYIPELEPEPSPRPEPEPEPFPGPRPRPRPSPF